MGAGTGAVRLAQCSGNYRVNRTSTLRLRVYRVAAFVEAAGSAADVVARRFGLQVGEFATRRVLSDVIVQV